MTISSTIHRVVPVEQCFFAVLDAQRGVSSQTREALAHAFDDFLPIPVEELQACYTPLDGDRVLACGVPIALARQATESGAFTLSPSALPAFVIASFPPGAKHPDPTAINFLTGEFSPRARRRAHRREATLAAIAVILCGAMLVVGVERRRSADQRATIHAREVTRSVLEGSLPPAIGAAPPASLRLVSELRRLRAAAGASATSIGEFDAASTLQSLLALWPKDAKARTDRLAVAPAGLALSTTVQDHDAARDLAAALGGLTGWTLAQPQIAATRDGTQLRLQFNPRKIEPAEGDLPESGARSVSPSPSGGN